MPGAIGTVERFHTPLRSAYDKIRRDLARDVSDEECLDMAVFAINATIGPEGPGVIPRPARKEPSSTQSVRGKIIETAMNEVKKVHENMRIVFGLNHTVGPKALKIS